MTTNPTRPPIVSEAPLSSFLDLGNGLRCTVEMSEHILNDDLMTRIQNGNELRPGSNDDTSSSIPSATLVHNLQKQ